MKKIWYLLLTMCLSLSIVATITSCGFPSNGKQEQEQEQEQEQNPQHIHKTNEDWATDNSYHWHTCDDCVEELDKEAHIWNTGVVLTPASENENGVMKYTCTVCAFAKTEEFDLWASYFDFERMKNVTVTSSQTDVTNNDVTNTNIKIDGERWERLVADFSYNATYYKTCIVYFDGEKTYLNGEESNCPVYKSAFFSFINFSEKEDLFTNTHPDRYEMGENTFKLYGFTISNVVIIIEDDCLKSISMSMTMGNTLLTLEYHFFDWGTTTIQELASNNESVASQGLELVKNNSGTNYAIKSIGTCTDTDIVIPNTYEGLPVVAIMPEAFMGNTTITNVVIPDSILLIYESAFMNCTSLESVELGSGLMGIWECAFGNCTNLKEIDLPNGLEYIYTHAFDGCSSLKEIVIPDSVTMIDPWAFANCTSLQSISFSDNISLIAESMCYGCTSLTSIDFGSGVTHVRPEAFYGCISLERLYIPKNIIALTRAFGSCGALNFVEFETTNGWKWASKHGFFNSKDVTNPETNAYHMTGVWNESSWQKEAENE